MATGDLLYTDTDIAVSAGGTISFSSTPPEGSAIILFLGVARGSDASISLDTPPSDFTLLGTYQSGATTPVLKVYAKIAGASESNSYSYAWNLSTIRQAGIGFVVEGTLSLGELSVSGAANDSSLGSIDVPPSAMSTSAGNGLALFSLMHWNDSASPAADNSFGYTATIIGSTSQNVYGSKAVTHPDTDIQTTVSALATSTDAAAMVLVEPSVGPGAAVTISDVNTTEQWTDGDTGLVITGTGFT